VPDPYVDFASDVSFGDIFESAFLFDVHLRKDAVQLGAQNMSARYGGGLAFSARYPGNRHYVLGRGGPFRAILITDNCAVDTALDQRHDASDDPPAKPKGRLLFAPLTEADADVTDIPTFGRFLLPPCPGRFGAHIAELRRCFMVDARDVAEHKDSRVASLDDDLAEALEVRWNAFAVRRGPLANARNAEKLLGTLTRIAGREDAPTEDELSAARSLTDVLAATWRLEGAGLEAVGDAFDRHVDGHAPLLQRIELASSRLGVRVLAE
jgi:hypothetical protein